MWHSASTVWLWGLGGSVGAQSLLHPACQIDSIRPSDLAIDRLRPPPLDAGEVGPGARHKPRRVPLRAREALYTQNQRREAW